jgi:hypothetical protein
LEVGSLKMEDGRWKMEDGRWKLGKSNKLLISHFYLPTL